MSGILLARSDERMLGDVKTKGAINGKTDTKQNSRPGRAGVLFQRDDDRGAAIPGREIPASSIQQQRVVRAFGHWTHGHVADQKRRRLAVFAWEMHVTAARRMACQASRIQATMIGRRVYMAKGVRKSITIPGLLAPTVKQRCREFGHSIFTPYAVELVCYDLRSDAKHSITLEIARDTQPAQDAVDRELVVRYRPGQPRKGLLVQLVDRIHRLQSIAAANRHDLPLPPLSAVAERVTFPFEIWRLVDVRWKELGYRSLSAYITGLIRYDLLVSGPHSSLTADCRSKLQRKLTRKTLADRRKGRRRKILLDHLIEEAEGRAIPEQELERVKARIVRALRRISFSPGSAKIPTHTISFQREPICTPSRGASTVKVERSAASNTFTTRSER
jgi:hypothetical protein